MSQLEKRIERIEIILEAITRKLDEIDYEWAENRNVIIEVLDLQIEMGRLRESRTE